MVPMSTAVVAHRAANALGHGGEVADQFLERLACEIGSAFEGLVQIRHISGVMFPVMDFHRAGVDIGFQRRGGVGQCG